MEKKLRIFDKPTKDQIETINQLMIKLWEVDEETREENNLETFNYFDRWGKYDYDICIETIIDELRDDLLSNI